MPKLSDNQVGDCLLAALEAVGIDEGETIRGIPRWLRRVRP
jgi:hypothetical protein